MNKMKLLLAVAAAAICQGAAQATLIGEVDLGPSRIVHNLRGDYVYQRFTLGATGIPLSGQPLPIDIDFGGQFIRLFSNSYVHAFDIRIPLSGTFQFLEGVPAGSAYFVDALGKQIGEPISISASVEGIPDLLIEVLTKFVDASHRHNEAFRDAISAVSGTLDASRGGPAGRSPAGSSSSR
jgi:hypothetical protein